MIISVTVERGACEVAFECAHVMRDVDALVASSSLRSRLQGGCWRSRAPAALLELRLLFVAVRGRLGTVSE